MPRRVVQGNGGLPVLAISSSCDNISKIRPRTQWDRQCRITDSDPRFPMWRSPCCHVMIE